MLTLLLVVCMLMNDQSTSLFVEAVSAAALQPGEEDTLQPGNGETSEEIQGGGEEQEQENSGQEQAPEEQQEQEEQPDEQQPQEQQTPGEQEMPVVQSEELTVSISAVNSSAAYGDQVILNGTVSDPSAALQWQYSPDNGESWQDISGANGSSYTFAYSADNASYQYRLRAEQNGIVVCSDTLTIAQSMTFAQVAEEYYGENGTQPTASATISLLSALGENNTIKAGDTIMISIEYILAAAALYNYGEQVQPLFDTYDGTEIVLYLPDGLSVVSKDEAGDTLQGVTLKAPEKGENNWTFSLNNTAITASSDTVGSFQVAIRVEDNGALATNHIFDFKEGADLMEISTSITIKDRTDPNDVKDGVTYEDITKPTESTFPDLKSATDDQWHITKSQTGTPAVDENKDEITFSYILTVGLLGYDESGQPIVVSDPQSYARLGRVPFATKDNTISLTEIPAVNDRDGNPLEAKSITITPQFDNLEPISAEANSAVELPVDTCQGNVTGSDVDGSAPYYSQYRVEVVYDYDKFQAEYYDTNQDPMQVDNTAKITYRLAGEDADRYAESSATQEVNYITEPAKLTIEKYIVDEEETGRLYSSANFSENDPVKGSAQFQIRTEDGGVPNLYTITDDGTYKLLENAAGTVAINPQGDLKAAIAGTDGTVTVYLDPDTYVISEVESGLPENTEKISDDPEEGGNAQHNSGDKRITIAAGEDNEKTASFYNRETLGTIQIHKDGKLNGSTSVLAGAVFGLYSDDACTEEITRVTTGSDGNAVFERLPYGTYYVKEIRAPEGYIPDTNVHKVVLSSQKTKETVSSVNNYNQATVILQKWVQDPNGAEENEYTKVNNTNSSEFNGCFTVERKNSDGSWSPVEGRINQGLTGSGTLTVTLPVYENDGVTPITYHFAEQLPKGWHGAADKGMITSEDGTTVYTKSFTLENFLGSGSSDAYPINMYNDRNGSIEITKNFYNASASGMTAVNTGTADFDLYYREGSSGNYVKYNTDSYQISAGGTITIADLPRTGTGGDRYYYLVETPVTDYEIFEDETGDKNVNGASRTTITVDGDSLTAYGPFNFTEGMGGEGQNKDKIELEQEITFSNVQQKVPLVVKKENSYTGAFVSGAKYVVYEYDEGADNHQGDPVITETEITGSGGSFSALDPGKKYLVVETVTPEHYTDVTTEKARIVDLTDIDVVDTETEVHTVTLSNRPDPTVRIVKQIRQASTSGTDGSAVTTLNGVDFEVYTKEADGSFTRAQYNGQDLTLTSGSTLQLPAGKYYLKEIVPEGNPNGVLNPSEYPDLYKDYDHETGTDGSFYFGPYTVEDQSGTQTLGKIINDSQNGAVRVKKVYAAMDTSQDTYIELEGATIGIFRGDEEVKSGTSEEKTGFVTFTGLPVYDESGDPITYTIKEIAAPDGYTPTEEEIQLQLTPGTLITALDGEEITLVNEPEMNFNVEKTYYNVWENRFTNKAYELPGTVIALYHWNRDTEVYEFVEVKETDSIGRVSFEGLSQREKYVAVEVRQPQGEEYLYLEPEEGEYLDRDYVSEEDLPKTLTEDKMSTYYHVTKEALKEGERPVSSQTAEMVNEEHWTQLQIKKFVIETQGSNVGKERLINNAEFELYQQIIDISGEERTNQELAFDPDNCTLIGTYSSGTLYDCNGVRQDGYFATDILKSADNVVYWLVETDAGIGASIRPSTAITLVKREGTEYTNVSTYPYGDESGEATPEPSENCFTYQDDTLTREAVENNPEYGPGSAMFSTVRIAKWAGQRDEEGEKVEDFTPLGNATFYLYLADSRGGLHGLLDTLTTGLDNDLSAGAEDQELTAWASSRAFSWTDLTEEYQKAVADGDMTQEEYNDIFPIDENGNGYVRVAIVESDAPAGYMTEQSTYYMYMFFRNIKDQTTEIFNDAYYVTKDDDTGALDPDGVLSPPLAEEQDGITWAFYPTEETARGEYSLVEVPEGVSDKESSQYRLVNWPIDNFAVTIQNYGYDPILRTGSHNLTTEALDAFYDTSAFGDRVALGNVEMLLERYVDGSWQAYDYENGSDGTFTLNGSGYFAFPNGLNIGQYRIHALPASGGTDPMEGYERVYDGSAEDRYYYFDVSADNVNISLYNPVKQSLTIEKKDMTDGSTGVSGITFTLTEASGATVTGVTDSSGEAVLTGIGTGTYKLTENEKKGYTNQYFGKYFTETYSGESYAYTDENNNTTPLTDLVTGDGIFLGYTYTQGTNSDGSTCTTVSTVRQISDYGIDTSKGIQIEIQNPQTVGFTIQKTDRETGAGLSGAQFEIQRLDFENCGILESGKNVTITGIESGWQEIGTFATGTDGTYTYAEGEPGIYRVTEVQAPDGYDITDAGPEYLALTGGLDIDSVTLQKDEDSTESILVQVTGNKVQDDEQVMDFTFQDKKKVTLTLKKDVANGNVDVEGSPTFTFTLYEEDKSTQVGTRSINWSDGGKNTASFKNLLSQGKTYYLKETGIAQGYALDSVSINGSTVTPDGNGFYAIQVPDDSSAEIEVTVVNTYLWAEVAVLKVDGNTGEPLSGADFKIVSVDREGTETEVSGAVFTENPSGSGVYRARVPLAQDGETTFRIYETRQPDNYLLDRENYAEFTLKPGESQNAPVWNPSYLALSSEEKDKTMLSARIFPNYRGAYVDIVKYDNVRSAIESEAEEERGTLEGAPFTLYRWTEDSAEEGGGHWDVADNRSTDSKGSLHFTVDGGSIYAVSEGQVPGYRELEGLWPTGGQDQAGIITAQIEGRTVTLHLINGGNALTAGEAYRYSAYNVPYVGLEIRKENVDAQGTVPSAVVNVYRVPDGTGEELTREEVAALMTDENLVINNVQVSTTGTGYRYANGTTDNRLSSSVVAGETYLAVETSSSISQIRDNSQVDWYQVFTVSAEEPEIVTLRNMEGQVSLSLGKEAEEDSFTSLLTQGAQAVYTITPQMGDNTYPLTGFKVEDQGLTAFHEESSSQGSTAATEIPLLYKDGEGNITGGAYTISQVSLGTASHEIADLAPSGTDSTIYAVVTFYDFQGNQIGEPVEVNVSQSAQTVPGPQDTRAASFTVSYICKGLEEETAQGETSGYALGTSFTPGTIRATVDIDRQEGGADVQSIDRIRNTALAEADYDSWTGNGTRQEAEPVKATANEDITFGEQETAVVTVSKEAFDPDTEESITTAYLEDVIGYRITLTNDETAGADMENPFIVDFLPQGTSWVRQGEDQVELITEESSDLTLDQAYPVTSGEETAVFADLNGHLAPGESVTVILYVQIENAVVTYGSSMNNFVLGGSNVRGSQTEENPRATSYKNGNREWPGTAEEVLSSYMSSDRISRLQSILGERAGFGYIADRSLVSWNSASETVLSKTGYGDRDVEEGETGYTSDQLSTVENGGTMYYRLSVSNNSSNALQRKTDFSLIDVLPAPGDRASATSPRESSWSLNFGNVAGVVKTDSSNGETPLNPGSDYKIYYYTGTVSYSGEDNIYEAAKNIKFSTLSQDLPAGWTEVLPQDKKEITAFLVAVNDTISLGAGESLIVEYTGQVNGGTELSPDELNRIAYSNAANSFSCHYGTYATANPEDVTPMSSVLTSNTVSATILPEPVQVGGRIWIDKDGDGVRDEDEDAGSFADNTLVQDMLQNIQLRLNTYQGYDTGTPITDVKKSENWNDVASYWFENLDPAAYRDNIEENSAYDDDNNLIISMLKGSSPATYQVSADLSNVTGKFGVTSEGASNGRSRNPEGGIPDEEYTDNNFVQASGSSTAASERFFLWSSSQYDMTKDLGLVLYRDLTITKQAQDDPSTKIEGARFTVYGPFDTSTISSNDLTEENIVKNPDGGNQFITDADGKITVSDLLWYKYYVIVEEEASTGYELDSAQAAAAETTTNLTSYDGVSGKPAWLLGIPDDAKDSSIENITVTNKREVDVTLEASKELLRKGQSQSLEDGTYTFTLSTEPEGAAVQTKTNDDQGEVIFDSITLDSIGIFTYYIREVIPEEEERIDGVEYDDTVYRAVITTSWTDNGLTAETVYQIQNADGDWVTADEGADFTNEYKAQGELNLTASKTVNGQSIQETEAGRFIFTLTPQGDAPGVTQTKTNNADGTVAFDPISFNLENEGETYTYLVQETGMADGLASGIEGAYTVDTRVYTVSVTPRDNGDGTMTVTPSYTYPGNDGEAEPASALVFDNTYTATGTWTPVGTKTLTGRDMAENEKFTFNVTETTGGTEKVVSTGTAEGGDKDEAVNISFTQITYGMDDVGTHEYVVRETGNNGNGLTLSQAEYKVTVTVSDSRQGSLRVAASYENGQTPAFENIYTAQGSLTLTGTKTVNGQEPENYKNSNFSFTLTPLEGAPGETQTVQNNGEGQITFAEITYGLSDAGKTYTYRVEETGEVPEYYTKDTSVYTVEVTVNDDGKGHLTPDVTYTVNGEETEAITFNNTYTATGSLTLTANKTVNSHTPAADENGDFTFSLSSAGEDTPSISQTKVNNGSTITFDPINYTLKDAGKTYTYQVAESDDKLPEWYEKDDRVYTVEVTIEDNGDGTLTAVPVYKIGDETVDEISFNNIYTAETSLALTAKKTVNDKAPENYQNSTFTFTLTPQNGAPGDVQTAQNDEEGNVAFAPITYTLENAGNTYTYQVTESETVPQGYTRDDTVYTVSVYVEDTRNGSLRTTVTYTKPDEEGTGTVETEGIAFDNTYEASGSWTPAGTKTLTGRDMTSDEKFTFTVKDQDNNTVSTGSVTGAAEGTAKEITFTPVNYTLEDAGNTYTYTISEDRGNTPPGVEMTDKTYEVQVKIKDNGDGTLTAVPEYTDGAAAFVNVYEASNQLTIQAEKTVNGKAPAADESGKFSFVLKSGAGTPALETTVENTGSTVIFPAIVYNLEDAGKTYTYTLEEQDISGGYAKDRAVYTITLKITDGGDGELDLDTSVTKTVEGETTKSGLDQITFDNSYKAKGTWTPEASKRFEGRDMQPGESFTFAVVDAEDESKVFSEGTVSAIGDGQEKEITFEPIRYTLDANTDDTGEYQYLIIETTKSGNGITADTHKYPVTVTVTDNRNGTLNIEASNEGTEPVFENSYTASGSLEITADKTVNGAEPAEDENQKFAFTLESGDENTPEISQEKQNEGGKVTFDRITYGLEDIGETYTYIVKESQTVPAGYTSSKAEYRITARISDNYDGTLKVDKTIEQIDGEEDVEVQEIAFNNTYEAAGTWTPAGTKALTGRDMNDGESFTFEVVRLDGEEETVVTTGKAEGGANSEAVDIRFTPISFTLADAGKTYDYVIRETGNPTAGMTLDPTEYYVSVSITDNRDGTLKIIPDYGERNPDFTNTYTVKPTTFTPVVEKLLTGADTPADKTFYFTMEADRSNLKNGAQIGSREAQISGPGQTNFESITFTQAGTYRFFITENQGSQEDYRGYTFDDTTWMLIITVEDIDSQLTVNEEETMYLRTDEATGEKVSDDRAVFTNDYQAEPVDYQLQVSKTVTGDDRPSEENFRFNLTEILDENEGAQLPQDTSIEITGSGEAAFDAIHFTKAGTYRFEIREENTEKPGYHYDDSTWTATVEVTDHDSQLEVTAVTYEKNGEAVKDAQAAAFENVYDTETADYTPVVTKKLTGDERPADQEKTFRFTMEAAEDNPEGAELSGTEAEVQGAGHTSFDSIHFTKAGTYRFMIRESAGEEKGYTYDSSEWTLTVTVEDLDSILTVTEAVYQNEGEERPGEAVGKTSEEDTNGDNSSVQELGAVFTNDYQVTETTWQPQVEKKVIGDMPENETFRFTLAASRENPEGVQLPENLTAEAEVDKDTGTSGKAAFDEITFTRAGTYQFQITEADTGKAGYTYDGNIWTVTVKITDEDSLLTVADVTYAKAGQVVDKAEDAAFENVYETRAAAFTPTVKKTITGDKAPDEKVFWFTLEADENNPEGAELQTTETSVKGEGTASFGNITFTKAGTYKFYLREKDGGEKGYTYDTSRWMLTVTVKDKDSILTVEKAAYTKVGELFSNTEAAAFQNKYTAEKTTGTKPNTTKTTKTTEESTTIKTTTTRSVKTGDTSDVLPWIALMSASALAGAGVVNRRRRKKRR